MSTYARFLLFVLSIFLLHSAASNSGVLWAQGEVITFSVTGDVPYGGSEVSEFQAIIDDHNLYSPSDFIVHVGDIKSGGGSCGESHYTQMREMLLTSAVPAYIVIGDNEWTDCSDQDQAWSYWMQHLFKIESNFCATPTVERHPTQEDLFAFVQKGVLFIGINLVGGGNDSAILQADAEWIDQQMVAKKSQVRAAVVFAQAKGSGSFATDFAASAVKFGKPVLYIQGNKHGWSYSDPWLESNITRVIIDRGNKPPVHVTVAMSGENPFSFERDPWPSGTPTVSRAPCGPAGPSIAISDASVSEGNSGSVAAVFDVTMTNLDGTNVTVQYSTSDISTTSDVDYVAQSGSVILTDVAPSASITVLVNGDGDFEPDETFRVELSAVSHGSIADGEGIGSILNDDAPAAPVVASFAPAEGAIGTEVMLTGANYVEISSVMFNDVAAVSYSVDSPTQIRAIAPAGGSGPITVSNSGGSGSSGSPFSVLSIPSIASFSPSGGPAGEQVTIDGFHFNGTTSVSFNGTGTLDYQVMSDTQLQAMVPVGASTGKIRVTNGDGMGESTADFAVLLPPVVSSFSPSSGPPGTEVSILGNNCAQVSSVMFSSMSASSFTVISDNEVRAMVPLGASSGPITVENLAGGGTSASNFSVTSPPSSLTFIPIADSKVKSSSPNGNYGSSADLRVELEPAVQYNSYLKFQVSGAGSSIQSAILSLHVMSSSDDGGAIYAVSNNYKGTSTPWVEGGLTWNNAPEIASSPLSALAKVSSGSIVQFDLTAAISGDGVYSFCITNGSADAVKYTPREGATPPELRLEALTSPNPVVSSFNPASEAVGRTVTIHGLNFSNASGVKFNGVSATFSVFSGVELHATVPSGASSGKISVTNPDGTGESNSDFSVISVPVISSFSPSVGPAGTVVIVAGSNLGAVSSVKFNGLASATVNLDSDSQLRATVPAGASSGLIELTNVAGSRSSASPFTVAQVPVVSSFSPASGVEGITLVTINGSNFTQPSSISFGNVAATSTNFISETQCTALVPAGAVTGKIKVTNADGTGESASDFNVVVAPSIASFSPASGPPGTEVTIAGNNCAQVTAVMFNGAAASSFNAISDTQINATVPRRASSGKISVVNMAGSAASASNFDVTAPPSAMSFIPVHDSYVRSDRASSIYGGKTHIDIEEESDPGTKRRGLFKFDISGLLGAVQSAKLRLYVTNAGNDGGAIYPISNEYSTGGSWIEGGVNWNNAPAISGSPLSSTGAVAVGDIVDFDVTNAINGNGIYSFGIMNNSKSRMEYSSKEGPQMPELIIEALTSPVPVISSFSPSSGVAGSSEVTISGLNFSGTTSVSFNGTPVSTINSNTGSQLKVTVPAGATTGKIAVTNADGTGQSASDFAVILPPSLAGFSPSSGPEGMQVMLNGSNLSHVTTVAFGATAANNFTIDSDALIRVNVPVGASDAKLSVTSMAGSAETSGLFTVTLPPPAQITSFAPASGPAGTEVMVSGQNLAGVTSVSFGGLAASAFQVDSDTQLRATVPPGATTSPILVTNGSGTGQSATDFQVTAAPSSLTFTPSHDAHAKSSKPDGNYGSIAELRVELELTKAYHSYLKFDVTGIGGFVQSAKLRFAVVSGSNDGGSIYSVSSNYKGTATPWEESGLTWNNAPEIAGNPLSTLGKVSSGGTVEFDVTAAISGDGIYSFGISNGSTDAVRYTSKEGSAPPELVIETSSSVAKRSPFGDDSTEGLAEAEMEVMPESIALRPAYPNPFNLSTTIEYGLPEPGAVRLSVHNVRGQEVRLLVDGDLEGGFQRVIWNGRDNRGRVVGSGVYFVRLIAGRQILTQVLTLQK